MFLDSGWHLRPGTTKVTSTHGPFWEHQSNENFKIMTWIQVIPHPRWFVPYFKVNLFFGCTNNLRRIHLLAESKIKNLPICDSSLYNELFQSNMPFLLMLWVIRELSEADWLDSLLGNVYQNCLSFSFRPALTVFACKVSIAACLWAPPSKVQFCGPDCVLSSQGGLLDNPGLVTKCCGNVLDKWDQVLLPPCSPSPPLISSRCGRRRRGIWLSPTRRLELMGQSMEKW